MSATCGPLPVERISTQDVFKKESSPEIRALYRKHAIGNSLFRNRGPKRLTKRLRDKTELRGRRNGPMGLVQRRIRFRS